MVVLPIKNVADALDVAAQPRKTHRIKVAFPPGGINWIVDRVIGDRRRDGTRNDSIQCAGTGNAAELNLGEEQLGSVVEGGNVGARQPVLQPDASEGEFPNGIAGESGETGAVLIVILDELRVDADCLSGIERRLAGLVKLVAAGKNRETRRDGAVKQIRLGESENQTSGKIPEIPRGGPRFPPAGEIAGLIGPPHPPASPPPPPP